MRRATFWTTVAGVPALLATVAAASGSLNEIGNVTNNIIHLATKGYVDGEIGKLAGALEPSLRQINTLGAIVADQEVRGLKEDLKLLNAEAERKEALIRAMPDDGDLRVDARNIADEIEQVKARLDEALCRRTAIISQQDSQDCRRVSAD